MEKVCLICMSILFAVILFGRCESKSVENPDADIFKDGKSTGENIRKQISNNEGENAISTSSHKENFRKMSRMRRSSYEPNRQPSAGLQTILSGNWHSMDPHSLLKLVNSLAVSKETLPDDYYGEEMEDESPIGILFSGKKPLTGTMGVTSGFGRSTPGAFQSIPIMTSHASKTFVNDYEDDNEPTRPRYIQMHKLKVLPHGLEKRFHNFDRNQGWVDERNPDLIQLSNGEIAFTPHGIQVLRHNPPAFVEEDLPFVRRPIL